MGAIGRIVTLVLAICSHATSVYAETSTAQSTYGHGSDTGSDHDTSGPAYGGSYGPQGTYGEEGSFSLEMADAEWTDISEPSSKASSSASSSSSPAATSSTSLWAGLTSFFSIVAGTECLVAMLT